MMRTGRILIVSGVMALFGVVSAVLGFVAEATRLKPDDIGVTRSGCVYPANPAFVVALCAAFLLAVAQIIASAAGGWCGCCRPGTTGFRAPKSKRFLGIIASILSWIAALIAIAFYLQGAAWNAPVARGGAAGGCYYLRPGVFRRAAVLSLVAAGLGIASYVLLTRRPSSPMAAAAAGYAPKPDGHHPPPAAVEMQQGPYGHQAGYGQQPAYPPPTAAQAGAPYGHRQEYGQQPAAYPTPAAQAAGPYGGQAPPNPQYAPPAPPATGQGHAYADV